MVDLDERLVNDLLAAAAAVRVTSGVARAIQYFHAIRAYLQERKSPYQAIVAFSGEHEYGGKKVTEVSLNGFPSNKIADKVQEDPYRFLICADKFQTGYDEPLLHTMYVDKPLSGIKAVQTLSRLNRASPQKHDVFVLDFQNDAATIEAAFADYYRTTVLSEETDPNKLHDLKAALDGYQVVYATEQATEVADRYLAGAQRDMLDPILDVCVATYKEELEEDGQVDFKGKAKAFIRTYGFLASILPYTNAEWERCPSSSIFSCRSCPHPKRMTSRTGSSKRLTWTATVSRSKLRCRSSSQTPTPRSVRCRRRAGGGSLSPSSTAFPTSSRLSTISSATSPGPTPIGCSG
jgi:type I restriction enzyme R subunit